MNAKAAFGYAISTIQRGTRGFPCFPQSLFGFFGKNGHMAPSIAPCALFASDAFRIALRMIFIAISYLKFATIQNSFATCISAMKALLIGKEYNTCDICDLFKALKKHKSDRFVSACAGTALLLRDIPLLPLLASERVSLRPPEQYFGTN